MRLLILSLLAFISITLIAEDKPTSEQQSFDEKACREKAQALADETFIPVKVGDVITVTTKAGKEYNGKVGMISSKAILVGDSLIPFGDIPEGKIYVSLGKLYDKAKTEFIKYYVANEKRKLEEELLLAQQAKPSTVDCLAKSDDIKKLVSLTQCFLNKIKITHSDDDQKVKDFLIELATYYQDYGGNKHGGEVVYASPQYEICSGCNGNKTEIVSNANNLLRTYKNNCSDCNGTGIFDITPEYKSDPHYGSFVFNCWRIIKITPEYKNDLQYESFIVLHDIYRNLIMILPCKLCCKPTGNRINKACPICRGKGNIPKKFSHDASVFSFDSEIISNEYLQIAKDAIKNETTKYFYEKYIYLAMDFNSKLEKSSLEPDFSNNLMAMAKSKYLLGETSIARTYIKKVDVTQIQDKKEFEQLSEKIMSAARQESIISSNYGATANGNPAKCFQCSGTGKCYGCSGKGKGCYNCNGSGRCSSCGGSGAKWN
ncbi:MAG: hypothetical protein WC810_22820 [Janthinobacterium sp.]|jgi:hypothetical protein